MSNHLRRTLLKSEIPRLVKQIKEGIHPLTVAREFGLHPDCVLNFLPKKLKTKVKRALTVSAKADAKAKAEAEVKEAEEAAEALQEELADAEKALLKVEIDSEAAIQIKERIDKIKESLKE